MGGRGHSEGASSRTILARAAAAHSAQEALDAGEIRVATRRARGESVKSIAIELGWCDAAVHRCIAIVMRKLKMRSPADLVALLQGRSPWGLTASRSRSSVEDFLVLTYPMPFPRTVANQVASIFRKLNVGSRIEMFVALRPR